MKKNGLVIAWEGLDAAGKGIQTKLVLNYLNNIGIKNELISFPRYETLVGKTIARYLQGGFGDINSVPYELICMAYAADRLSMANHIEENKNNGIWTILDRYTYSNLFTAAKLPEDKWSEFIEWVEKMEFDNLGVIEPDYNFYLYIDPKLSIQRIKERGNREYQQGKVDIHEDNEQLLINTAKCYLNFAKTRNNWFIVDQMENGEQISQENVFNKIKYHLDYILNKN